MARKQTTNLLKIVVLGGLALGVSGCESTRETFGLNKQAPDEFQVVSRAPLSLPPDFTMRVPEPGAPRPQTGSTTDQARRILVGDDPNAVKRDITEGSRSKGQVALLSQSGFQIRANKGGIDLFGDDGFTVQRFDFGLERMTLRTWPQKRFR